MAEFGQQVAVYEIVQEVTVDVRYTLLQKRKIGVLDDGGNAAIHRAVLDEAGFVAGTHYIVIPTATLIDVNEYTCLTGVSEPHFASTTADGPAQAVRKFVASQGNFLGQCAGLITYENNATYGRFQTTQDALPVGLAYNAGTMKAKLLDNSSTTWCPAGTCNDTSIFNEVNTNGTALGDGDSVNPPNDADIGSHTAASTTLDFGNGNNTNNSQLDVTADSVWAVIFTVTVN